MPEVVEERQVEQLRLRKVQHHCGQVTCETCETGQFCWFVSDEDQARWFLGGIGPAGKDQPFFETLNDPKYRIMLERLAVLAGYTWDELEYDLHEPLNFLMEMFNRLELLFNYQSFADMLIKIPKEHLSKFRRLEQDNPRQTIDRIRIMYAFPRLQNKRKKTL